MTQESKPLLVNYYYSDLKYDLIKIAEQTKFWKPELIIGLTRGGLIPAVMLSHYYNVQMLPLNYSTMDFVNSNKDLKHELINVLGNNKDSAVLIIDDIVDTGHTIKAVSENINILGFNNVKYGCIHYNLSNQADFTPDFYSRVIDKSVTNQWIIYPWEAGWHNV